MRRTGFSEDEVARRFARQRRRLLARCPVCGFPPPPPLRDLPALPRLPRVGLADHFTCRACGRSLPKGRRRYCTDACWREHVRSSEMQGEDVVSPAPPRAHRLGRAYRVGTGAPRASQE